MKKLSLLFAAAFAVFAMACTPSETTDDSGTITLNSDSKVAVAPEGGEVTISFNATTAWRASSTDTDMARVKPAQGEAGDQTVTVTVSENGQLSERSATITIATSGGKKVSVEITQPAPGTIGISKTAYEIGAEGGEVEVIVTTNVEFEVSSAVDWISAAATKAIPEVSYKLAVEPSYVIEKRTGEVTFQAAGFDPITISITQDAFVPELAVVGETVVSKNGGTFEMTVEGNVDWVVEYNEDDYEFYVDIHKEGDKVVIELDPNEDLSSRNVTFTVSADGYDISQTVSIRQDGIADIVFNVSMFDMGFSADPVGQRLRLAYDGSNLLVSTQAQVVVVDPDTGEMVKALDMGDVPYLSMCSDDAGNIIFAGQYGEGETVEIYSTPSADQAPTLLGSFTQPVAGTAAYFRVRGDITSKAVISAVVASSPASSAYSMLVDVENGAIKGEPKFLIAPLPGMWSAYYGGTLGYGTSASEGAWYIGYAGDRDLYYTADGENWDKAVEVGNNGNQCINLLDMAEMGGKKYLALGSCAFFGYSDTYVSIFDVTAPTSAELVLSLGVQLRRLPTADDPDYTYTGAYGSGDVLVLPGDNGKSLVIYFAELGKDALSKVIIPLT